MIRPYRLNWPMLCRNSCPRRNALLVRAKKAKSEREIGSVAGYPICWADCATKVENRRQHPSIEISIDRAARRPICLHERCIIKRIIFYENDKNDVWSVEKQLRTLSREQDS
jgi:hypothetical protein